MPRHNSSLNELLDGHCTGQKQVCLSPSSTSSTVLKNCRFKRKILVTKRRGSTTPVPLWSMSSRPSHSVADFSETSQYLPSQDRAKEAQALVSARKLGNALWELNNTPSQKIVKDLQGRRSMTEIRIRDRELGSIGTGSLPHHPISELCNQSRSSSHRRMMPLINQKSRCKEHTHVAPGLLSKARLMGIEAHSQGLALRSSLVGSKNCLKDLQNNLATSKELVRILVRFSGLGKKQSSANPLATALYCQLDQALAQVDLVIQGKKSDHSEICCIMKQLVGEKESGRSRKQEGIIVPVQSVIEELETEKKLRRRAERINENLRMELAQMKTSLDNANKELQNERRTREMIEQVCSEVIRGIGEDKAEVEELKREYVKVREELEKERQMLQLADEWREERVQMKLSEAKYQFEEKNAAVDQLRYELEAFLTAKKTEDLVGQQDVADNLDVDCQRQTFHPSIITRAANLTINRRDTGREEDLEETDGTDSEDSDLHSIELNMENNNNGFSWSYAFADTADKGKLALAKERHERCTKCDEASGSDFSSDRVMTEEVKEKSTRNFQHLDDNLDEGIPFDNSSRLEQTGEGYISIEVPGGQNLAGSSSNGLPHGLLSSTRQWCRQQALLNKGDQVCVGSKVAELVKAIRESESKASLVRKNKVHSQLQTAPIQ